MTTCFFCPSQDVKLCNICKTVSTCHLHHSIHVNKTGDYCWPWRVEEVAGYGRICLATRDISPHQVVLEDQPVALSPTQDSPLSCLSCYRLLPPCPDYVCSCGFPLCSPACSQGEDHQAECRLFSSTGGVRRGVKDYPLIMPIRLMTLLEAGDTVLKDRVDRLMDHNKERQQEGDRWDWVEQKVVQPLLKLNSKWSKEDIHRCIGLFRTNACTTQARVLTGSEDGECGVVRMLYPSMAIFSHSCSPNTQALHRPDYGLTLTATRSIKAGEEITDTYTELWGSAVHRREDITNWFFTCTCHRCSHPEDLGSHLDTWACWQPQCRGQLTLRYVQLWPAIPAFPSWQCDLCPTDATLDDIKKKEDHLLSKLRAIDSSDESCVGKYEEFIKQNCQHLHNNHWILTQARVNILDVFESFGKINLQMLRIVAEQGLELVKLFEILKLGSISLRGYILYYSSVYRSNVLNSQYEADSITESEFKEGLLELQDWLEESIESLQIESPGTHKKNLSDKARVMLDNLRECISYLDFL